MLSAADAAVPAMVPPVPSTTTLRAWMFVCRHRLAIFQKLVKNTATGYPDSPRTAKESSHATFAVKLTARQQQILDLIQQRHRPHRRAAHARRNRGRTGLQVRQRGRRALAGAGAQGRHRTRQRHLARHPAQGRRPALAQRIAQQPVLPAIARHGAAGACRWSAAWLPARRSWRRNMSTRPTTSRAACSSTSPTTC